MKEFLGKKIKIISTNAEILKFYFFYFQRNFISIFLKNIQDNSTFQNGIQKFN